MIAIMLMAFERSLISTRASDVRQIECVITSIVLIFFDYWFRANVRAWMKSYKGGWRDGELNFMSLRASVKTFKSWKVIEIEFYKFYTKVFNLAKIKKPN